MGRLIKNFDMALPSFSVRGSRSKRFRVHGHPGMHFLYAFGNHAIAALQSFGNNPTIADAVAHFHRSYAHLVIAVHNRHLIATLQLRHSSLRHKQRALLQADGSANLGVAAGTQNISWIGK
jgi:hypothetical protein